jgi:protein tyrosine/serine phosphatase
VRNSFAKLIGVTLVSLFFAAISVAQNEPKYEELPNFHKVNERLFRGAQPRRGGIRKLSQLGIKTVIDLRDNDERSRAEEKEARAAGLRYFNVPLDRLGRPTDEEVNRVLGLIHSDANQTVFVHCHKGADRTGTVIAIYRIEHDGWTSKQAKEEANRYGMALWQRGMKDYIHDYYQRQPKGTQSAPVIFRKRLSSQLSGGPL